MSSSSASASSSGSTATSSDLAPPQVISSQAALYLYTFLVTLILLLTVSAAIILRTLFLRRRNRRLIEEAIRNGTYIPPIRTPRTLGTKPLLHDAVIDLYVDDNDAGEERKCRTIWWENLMPLAVWMSRNEEAPRTPQMSSPSRPPPSATAGERLHWVRRRLRSAILPVVPYTGEPAPSTLPASPPLPRDLSDTLSHSIASANNVCVAVLISMPMPPDHKLKLRQHQRRSLMSTSTSGAVPDVSLPPIEFGIAKVSYSTKENDAKDSESALGSAYEAS